MATYPYLPPDQNAAPLLGGNQRPGHPGAEGGGMAQPYGNPGQAGNATLSFHDTLAKIISQGTQMAGDIGATETQRYQSSLANTQQGAAAFDKPSMTDMDVRRQFSGMANQAGRDYSANIGQLRGALGGAGIVGGGYGSALAGKYEATRQASLTDATASLYAKRIDADVQDRLAKWNANQAVSSSIARDPSMVALDWLGAAGTLQLGEYGVDAQSKAAHESAKAQEKAGMMSGIGSALGAL